MAGHRRAVFAGAQRADVGAEHFGQHRHDPVGEVDRVTADARIAVDRTAGADIVADIGNRDQRAEAPLPVGLGPDRVVVITGIAGVNCHDRQMAQVFAVLGAKRQLGGDLGFFQRFGRKGEGNAVLVDRDQAERARREWIAEHADNLHPGARATSDRLGQYQLTRLSPAQIGDGG